MSGERFEVNGVWYDSIDDVPQPYRDSIAALLADRDGDGVPDVLNESGGSAGSHHVVTRTESFVVDGVAYASLDDIPERQQSHLRRAFGATDPAAHRAGERPEPTPLAATPIVTSRSWSNRTRLLTALVVVNTVVAVLAVWLLLR